MRDVGTDKRFESTVRANVSRDLSKLQEVMNDPRKVQVSKTLDTDCYVVAIIDSKGSRCSLWLDKSGDIGSVSPY